MRQHLAIDRDRQRWSRIHLQRGAAEAHRILVPRLQPQEARRPIFDQRPLVTSRHRLHDDAARLHRRLVHQPCAAMIGPVADPHLDHAQPVRLDAVVDRQHERLEPNELPRRPAEVADPSQHLLQAVRHCLGDLRADPHRGAIGEIIVVDHAQVDALGHARTDHLDRAFDIDRQAQRPREAVRRAERQHRQRHPLADQQVDEAADRPITPAQDHQVRLLRQRALDRRLQVVGIFDGMGIDRKVQPIHRRAGPLEKLLPFPRLGIDDHRGGSELHHVAKFPRTSMRIRITPA
ncbi:hypothetical protein WR25_12772 [Diploscapter pachys]|uniref:Uncharacterized protein n=1 Tax=Diploscapter pachys TaxID=2018661 RepID=A0A2A2K763_9BILA|nr:hypothetical protein WR25_12772 [Diploscapter pachys]